MKITPDELSDLAITGHGIGWIAVNGSKHESSLLVTSSGSKESIAIYHVQSLTLDDFRYLADLPVDIALLGTGHHQQFISPNLLVPLMNKGIGFESMSTAAACRTFNVLASEGRKVGALLLLPRES
jgi:uncharacterized protein